MKISFITIVLTLLYVKIVETKLETPLQFLVPGIVVVLSQKCKHSKKLTEFLKINNIPHKPIYLEDDEDALHYIMKECKGKVPWVYENGVLVGDGYTLIARYIKENPSLDTGLKMEDDKNKKKILGLIEANSRRQSTLLYDGKDLKILN